MEGKTKVTKHTIAKNIRYTKMRDPSLAGRTLPALSMMVMITIEIYGDDQKCTKKQGKHTMRNKKYCMNQDCEGVRCRQGQDKGAYQPLDEVRHTHHLHRLL
jgi:hypothetical protein